MNLFPEIQKNFGFGCMRLPMKGDRVDYEEMVKMVDTFMAAGFNYFDTARGYIGGKSELALRDCLTSRYPRESYVLTNKLSCNFFEKEEDIRPYFDSQLESCGVDYFDFYLMHAQDKTLFAKYKACRAYEIAMEFLAEGRIKHLGMSFHDKAEVLDQILTEYPQIEVVQIQLNYADYEDPAVESRKCLEVCHKHGKPVMVMEPVKGGSLVNLPDEAKKIFDDLDGGSYASYAIRFAAGQEGVVMVLSGMGNMEMMLDNLSYMQDFQPLNEKEQTAVGQVCGILRKCGTIPCTACRYCVAGCPKEIPIADVFACLNAKKLFGNWNTAYYYEDIITKEGSRAKDCIGCGACEEICPQHLPIREYMKLVSKEFDEE